MKAATDACRQVLAGGSFDRWYTADLYYGGERRLKDVPLGDVQISEDDTRAVKGQASCTIVWEDDFGASIMPQEVGDLFSPFGSELAVYAIVSAGRSVYERIPMGWFPIVDVPTMRDATMFFGSGTITTGTRLELKLQDRFVGIQIDDFDVPSSPGQLGSVWTEIGNLTGLPLVRSIPDAPISREVAYQEDRMQAVLDLADILGGVPYATVDGALSMRTKAWGPKVDTLRRGESGTIVEIGKSMSADGVYNAVIFRGQDDAQGTVLSTSEITYGPLRTRNPDGTRSPAGRRPTFRSNQFVTTAEQAHDYTDSELARVSTLKAARWPITELWNPLRELGDVVDVVDEHDTTIPARILAIDRSGGATQKVTVTRG